MITFVTYNVKGLNSPRKRRKIWEVLGNIQGDILGLQETHFLEKDEKRMLSRRYPRGYFSSFSAKRRGVAILIKKDCPLTVDRVIRDKEGRFIFVKGMLKGEAITLANLYAPNSHQLSFFQDVVPRLCHLASGVVILMGDFNCVMQEDMDRKGRGDGDRRSSGKGVLRLLQEAGLSDVWRQTHPGEKDYTFYSHPHDSYSRLDHIFLSNAASHMLQSASIGNITVSDHAPVSSRIDITTMEPKPVYWRMGRKILDDSLLLDQLREVTREFFELNLDSQTSVHNNWDAFKACVRGKIIQFSSCLNRAKRSTIAKLRTEIAQLEALHKRTGSTRSLAKLTHARGLLNTNLTDKIESDMMKTKQFYYEKGNKPEKLLAHKLKIREQQFFIQNIRSGQGDLTDSEAEKRELFLQFYANLYTKGEAAREAQLHFLSGLELPSLTAEECDTLEAPINREEVLAAIKQSKTSRAPGPDGLGAQFYKKLQLSLVDRLVSLFNFFRTSGEISNTMQEAVITLIPKPGKDLSQCGSYRPIALLNNDIKLYTKILAMRMERILPRLIGGDQTGFILGRQTMDNVRKGINIIHQASSSNTPLICLALDAEKAFDRVDWGFLRLVLGKFGFGPNFIQMVMANYSKPRALISVNGTRTGPFDIQRGTRQGCPLSPLLFALSMEPLAIKIREEEEIRGMVVGDHEYKICLFADDILVTLTDPVRSLNKLMTMLEVFREVAGFKINFEKSEAMSIGVEENISRTLRSLYPFKWATKAISYLGINLTKNYQTLYDENYPALIKTLFGDLDRWKNLNISWIGRIVSIKMNFLPRILYFFQTLPVRVPDVILLLIQRKAMAYIWNHKPPRVAKNILYRRREEGGLSCPNFRSYYLAAQARVFNAWVVQPNDKHWAHMEEHIAGLPLGCLLAGPRSMRTPNCRSHPILNFSFSVWDVIAKAKGLSPYPSPFTPLWNNPDFTPGVRNRRTEDWIRGDCHRISQLFANNEIKSFQDCKEEFNLEERNRFMYFQIRHWTLHPDIRKAANRDTTVLEDLIFSQEPLRGLVSTIYKILLRREGPERPKYMMSWEEDLGRQFSEISWFHIWNMAATSSICTLHKENAYKIPYRWYLVPTRLKRIYGGASDLCWRECTQVGSFIHIWWRCPKIQQYWSDVFREMERIADVEIPFGPLPAMLGVLPTEEVEEVIPIRNRLARNMLLAARLNIAANWKNPGIPSMATWLTRVWELCALDKITASLTGKNSKYMEDWYPFLMYCAAHPEVPQRGPEVGTYNLI